MIHNSATPNIEVDPETCEVRADGELITCEPADVLLDAVWVANLHAFTVNLISAGVCLVPLGQMDGLKVLAALEGMILDVAHEACPAGLDELGSSSFLADIASMCHETQYTRLFRS